MILLHHKAEIKSCFALNNYYNLWFSPLKLRIRRIKSKITYLIDANVPLQMFQSEKMFYFYVITVVGDFYKIN